MLFAVQILDNIPDKTRDGKLLLLLALDKSAGVMNGTVPLEAVLILVCHLVEAEVAKVHVGCSVCTCVQA